MKNIKAVGLCLSLIILIFIQSCSEDTVNSPDNRLQYELKVWDYSDNHYFLDTIYKESFLDYYNNTNISQQTNELSVDDQSFEVWVQTDMLTTGYRKAGLHIDLPELPSGGYNDSLKSVPSVEQGIRTFGLVRKLTQDEYILHKYAGYVSLKINLPDNYFAGVAYKRYFSGEQFGNISTDTNVHLNDTLVLKMVKVATLIPQNTLAWQMKLKNIYQLPATNVSSDGFEFDIKYLYNGLYQSTLPIPNLNTHLITILGLDKYTSGRSGGPDNKFDFLPNFTIDQENGWIIFPSLKPFVDNFESYNIGGVTIDSTYWYPELYSDLKANAKTLPNANNYILPGFMKSY